MDTFIAKIGKGLKGAKDLTWEESKDALRAILERQATESQTGAFLMAMRIKTESITELAAFTAITRTYVPPLSSPLNTPFVDLPLYGEKHNTIHGIIAASLVASSVGAGIFMHGVEIPNLSYDFPSVLRLLRLPITQSIDDTNAQLSQRPWVYMDMGTYHAPLTRLLDLRQEFGLQNLAHQVARLLNPARLSSQVIGIAHPPYLNKMVEALDMLGTQRALIIQGVEGYPELSIAAPAPARERRDGHVSPITFRPEDIGLRVGPFQAMSKKVGPEGTSSPEHEAHMLTQILHNHQRGDQRAWVIQNAALYIYAAGLAPSWVQAAPLAQEALDSGQASAFLQSLTKSSPTLPSSSEPPQQEPVPA